MLIHGSLPAFTGPAWHVIAHVAELAGWVIVVFLVVVLGWRALASRLARSHEGGGLR